MVCLYFSLFSKALGWLYRTYLTLILPSSVIALRSELHAAAEDYI